MCSDIRIKYKTKHIDRFTVHCASNILSTKLSILIGSQYTVLHIMSSDLENTSSIKHTIRNREMKA